MRGRINLLINRKRIGLYGSTFLATVLLCTIFIPVAEGASTYKSNLIWRAYPTDRSVLAYSVTWSNDGEDVLISADYTSSGLGHALERRDARTGDLLNYFDFLSGGRYFSIALSPKDNYMAVSTGSYRQPRLEVRSEKNLSLIWNYTDNINNGTAFPANWSPDGNLLAWELSNYTLILWNSTTMLVERQIPLPFNNSGGYTTFEWSPDSKNLAFHLNSQVMIWNVNNNSIISILTLNSEVHSMSWSPDGKWFAAGNSAGSLIVYSTTNWAEFVDLSDVLNIYNGTTGATLTPTATTSIAWSHDSSKLAVGTISLGIKVVSTADWKLLLTLYDFYIGHNIQDLAWSLTDTQIAFVSTNGGGVYQIYIGYVDDPTITYIAVVGTASGLIILVVAGLVVRRNHLKKIKKE